MAKIDLRSAYRSIPISPLDYKLTGIQWQFSGDIISMIVDGGCVYKIVQMGVISPV